MNIFLLCSWSLVLWGSLATSTDDNEHCHADKQLDEVCGSHTFRSVKPILNYVDQLQQQQLSHNEEVKEINDLREEVRKLQLQIAEGKLASELILIMKIYIKDLQTTISEHHNIKNILKKNVELANNEIVMLKKFFKEESVSNASKLQYYKDELAKNNITLAENAEQLKSHEVNLISCHDQNLRLNEELKESQKKLKESQDELQKQKEIILQKEEEESKIKKQMQNYEEIQIDCSDYNNLNRVRYVKVANFEIFPALCNSEIAGPGWTVIQQRIKGGEEFDREWATYKKGFGNFTGDFFLGLEKIHRLTNDKPHELYVHMESFEGNSSFARYDNFRIAGEDDKYRLLSLGSFSGSENVEDGLRENENQQFSTSDSDNDAWDNDNCYRYRYAPWWFNICGRCNPNGKFYHEKVYKEYSIWWMDWYSLKSIIMLIRPRDD